MKNKKVLAVLLAVLVVCLCACMFTGCTKKGENMLTTTDKGVFAYKTLDALQKDLTLGYGSAAKGVDDVFTMNYDEEDNEYSVNIDTNDIGWAYIGQKVNLSAGSYYRIAYSIKITSMSAYTTGKAYDGVFVKILEDDDFNYTENDLMQTAVGTGEYEVTFKATQSGEATIALAVGTEKYPVDAVVTLNTLTVSRINKADATVNYAGSFTSDYYGLNSTFNVFYIVMGAVAIALLCYFGYFMFQRHLYKNENGGYAGGFLLKLADKKYLGLIVVIASGLLITIITDVLSTAIASSYAHIALGYNVEGLSSQALFIAKYGPQNLAKSLAAFCTDNGYTMTTVSSMPLQMYFLGFVGLFGRIFEGIGKEYLATMFFLRFFTALANIGTAVVLYNLISKSVGNVGATIIASMYTLIPIVFASGALWGYTESVTALLILIAVSFMLKNNYVATAAIYYVACMFSMSALFVAPIILFYTILQCIKDIKKIIPAVSILVLGFVLFYALNVPFDINFINDGQPFYCFTKAWTELYTSALYTMNAFNFQAMLGNNFTAISTSSLVVTIVFIVFMLTLVGVAYFKFKNRMNLILLATVFINMMFVFCNNMQPISMFISLALMLAYAILNKEKRVYFSFILFAILMFVNISYAELFIGYTPTAINHMTANAVTYVFGAFELLAVLYYVYISYDIVVTKKVRKIKPMAFTYGEWLVNSFNRIRKGYYKLLIKLQRKDG